MQGKAKDVVHSITKNILKLMKEQGSQWTKPWANKLFTSVDGYKYTGGNIMQLAFEPYDRYVWGTYKQWIKHGCQVKKGESSTKLLFIKKYIKEVERKGETKEQMFQLFRTFDVFNIEQVEGNTEKFIGFDTFENKVNDNDNADVFIRNTKAKISRSGKACYIPSIDEIRMPSKESFINTEHSTATENYYCTMFHELTHWTGHKDRCDRKLSTKFGSSGYAFEELVAELGSCFIASHLNITSSPREDHAMYLNNWIKCLEENEDAIWKASSLASKSLDFCKNLQSTTNVIKEVA